MCTLPILPKDCSRRAGLPNDSLPAFYMADHSVLGLLIGRFDEALVGVGAFWDQVQQIFSA